MTAISTSVSAATQRRSISARIDRRWLIGFAVACVAFQVGIYRLGDTPLRMPLRIGMFAFSLALLCLLPAKRSSPSHPAARLFQPIVAILIFGILIPGGAGLIASVAQATLYVAVLAPLVWVPRLQLNWAIFRQVAIILWAFHAASAGVGALQVQYPGTFDGALSNNIDDYQKGAMTITLANGSHVLRPRGLTDTPGGAGASGSYAIILGFALLLTERSLWFRAVVLASMVLSLFGVYLSQGRTNLVVVGFALIVLLLFLFNRGDRKRAVLSMLVLAAVAMVGTALAFAVGGDMTVDRWSTLTADDPTSVANANRGMFLDEVIHQDIYLYPFGAGGGRWGMMNSYFGDPSKALWAEMMWQALVYDGGVPLALLYVVLLIVLIVVPAKIAVKTLDGTVGCWAAVLVGLNISTVAASFVFPIYIKDMGLEAILLSACLYGAADGSGVVAADRASSKRLPNRSRLLTAG